MWTAEECGAIARVTYRLSLKASTIYKREGIEALARYYENRRRDMQDLTLAVQERNWQETLFENKKKTRRRGNSDG
jgi:hypothetical protein